MSTKSQNSPDEQDHREFGFVSDFLCVSLDVEQNDEANEADWGYFAIDIEHGDEIGRLKAI